MVYTDMWRSLVASVFVFLAARSQQKGCNIISAVLDMIYGGGGIILHMNVVIDKIKTVFDHFVRQNHLLLLYTSKSLKCNKNHSKL